MAMQRIYCICHSQENSVSWVLESNSGILLQIYILKFAAMHKHLMYNVRYALLYLKDQ